MSGSPIYSQDRRTQKSQGVLPRPAIARPAAPVRPPYCPVRSLARRMPKGKGGKKPKVDPLDALGSDAIPNYPSWQPLKFLNRSLKPAHLKSEVIYQLVECDVCHGYLVTCE